jgi:uncharacterized membrane protein
MTEVEGFLTINQEQQIIDAIRSAEKNTSGEIRVHIEKGSNKETIERAKEVFCYLKMDETKAQNGVLFYVGVCDKKFAIIGDKGINKKVPTDFWNSTKKIVTQEFIKGNFTQGLINGIHKAGEQLKLFFPFINEDVNELEDAISKS